MMGVAKRVAESIGRTRRGLRHAQGRIARSARQAPLRFGRDRRGATAVEFGLVAVPFLGLLMAIFETGFVFFTSVGLQSAVQAASRAVLTGNAQAVSATVSTPAQFNAAYICPNLPSFISCSSIITDVRTATAFASADVTNDFYTTTTEYCPGAPGTIVVVRVAYPLPVFFPILGLMPKVGQITAGLVSNVPNQPGLKHLLLATSVFQTEPYAAVNYTKGTGC